MPTARAAKKTVITGPAPKPQRLPFSRGAVVAAVATVAASWVAAGSTGLIAQPLRVALVWAGLAVVGVAVWPRHDQPWKTHALLAAVIVLALLLLAAETAVLGVLGLALAAAVFACVHDGPPRRILGVVAAAAAVLGVYRLAVVSIPAVWSLANLLGEAIGSLTGAVSGKPLSIGATFAGLDLLVVMSVVWLGWVRLTAAPRRRRAVLAGSAIAAAHLTYLILLASATDIAASLPAAPAANEDPYLDFYVPPPTHWTGAADTALPWNLPLVGVVLHLMVLAAMLSRGEWPAADPGDPPGVSRLPERFRPVLDNAPVVLALLIPPLVALAPGTTDLRDRTILALDEGYLDWEKPGFDEYGQASAGMYGMLPAFVESLGGTFVRSADLADDALRESDVLIIFHPTRMWPEPFRERVWDYVRGGGSLLVVGGSSVPEDRMQATVNQVLQPTSMRIGFDTAAASVPNWQGAVQSMAHPAVSGTHRGNGFGLLLGPSIQAGWPARPLLVGQYGWRDPGCDAALTMSYRFDAGERLGDVVLAAEQRLGKGTVVVLADPFCLTNEGNPAAFAFSGRLLSYLANRPGNPQTAWRQVLGLLLCGLLIGMLVRRNDAVRVAAVAAGLIAALFLVESANAATAIVPEGRPEQPVPVAYIDGSHLEAYSTARWDFDDLAGLKLTLIRNGYLPLVAPDLESHRLGRAAMLISIAPAKPFSDAERQAIRQFVEEGGIFISMAGAEDAGASRRLLRDFGFEMPPPTLLPPADSAEPRHERHFRSRYLSGEATGGHDCYVWLHAAWPIQFLVPDIIPVVADFENRPLVAVRRIGKGKVVVIGDTGFAMNKNLEYVGGEPFGGGYENAHFWRWFLAFLNDRPAWIPPPLPKAEGTESSAGKTDEGRSGEASP